MEELIFKTSITANAIFEPLTNQIILRGSCLNDENIEIGIVKGGYKNNSSRWKSTPENYIAALLEHEEIHRVLYNLINNDTSYDLDNQFSNGKTLEQMRNEEDYFIGE